MLWYAMLSHSFLQTAACQASCEREVSQQLRWFHRRWTPELSLPGRATAEAGWPHVWTSLHSGHSSRFFWILLDSENSSWFFSVFLCFHFPKVCLDPWPLAMPLPRPLLWLELGGPASCRLSLDLPGSALIGDLTWLWGYGSIPMTIPFLGGWTSIYPSYFDVNYRGIGFWPIPTSLDPAWPSLMADGLCRLMQGRYRMLFHPAKPLLRCDNCTLAVKFTSESMPSLIGNLSYLGLLLVQWNIMKYILNVLKSLRKKCS